MDAPEDEAKTMHLRVGLPSGRVHTFTLSSDAVVGELAARVLEAEDVDASRTRLRFISAGHLLRNPSAKLGDHVTDGAFIHCALTELQQPQDDTSSSSSPTHVARRATSRRQAAIFLAATDGQPEVRILLPPLDESGMARLAEVGITEEQIDDIMREFRRMQAEVEAADQRGEHVVEQVEQPPERRRRRSRRRDDPRLAALGSGVEGTNTDFLMGCVCGYLLGVLVLVLLLDKNITRRSRVGIVAGVATNCAFGILRTTLNVRNALAAP